MLDKDGEIPQVFRSGVLKQNSNGSEMSKLMDEIEKDHHNDAPPQAYGETSLDSQMEDTPANYNQINQEGQDPYHGAIPEETNANHKSSKKKLVMVLKPSSREKEMAGAYGGQALGSIKRPGIKYEKERLKDSMKFRVSAEEEPQFRANLSQLVKSGSRLDNLQQPSLNSGSKRGSVQHESLSQKGSQQSNRPHYEERKKRA